MAKREYKLNDRVWIYGVSRGNTKPITGKVIKIFNLSECGYNDEPHYLIEIPTAIEPLLEVRTWHSISEDEKGPVGSFRELGLAIEPSIKFASHLGFVVDDTYEIGYPSPDEVHAAMEKSINNSTHQPLNLKDTKPKRRNYPPRKKKV